MFEKCGQPEFQSTLGRQVAGPCELHAMTSAPGVREKTMRPAISATSKLGPFEVFGNNYWANYNI
jgi:hypothetical protein